MVESNNSVKNCTNLELNKPCLIDHNKLINFENIQEGINR